MVSAMQVRPISTPNYTENDHAVWAALYQRQSALIQGRACRQFLEGMARMQYDPKRLPDPVQVSELLHRYTGWTLSDAQNAYLGPTEWFEEIVAYRFPVTNYIRKMEELEYTPMPDLFHEYFGHLAFFTDQEFADIAQSFGTLYLAAKTETQQLAIARLWWFSIEFGLIKEDGELRIFGAGLLSSPGELLHALEDSTPRYPFDIRKVAETPSAPYGYHEGYFIIDSLDHLRQIVRDYAKMENLILPE